MHDLSSILQGCADILRGELRVLSDDLFGGHSVREASEDRGYRNTGPSDAWLAMMNGEISNDPLFPQMTRHVSSSCSLPSDPPRTPILELGPVVSRRATATMPRDASPALFICRSSFAVRAFSCAFFSVLSVSPW